MTPIEEIAGGARTIEKESLEWARDAGVLIKRVEWSPAIPPQAHSVPESYSLKLQTTLAGLDKLFEVFVPKIPTEWLQDSVMEVRPEAARTIRNAIADARKAQE